MIKSRAFSFKIENGEEKDWKNICNLEKTGKCEYIVASIETKTINGFIRFTNPKHYNSVKSLLQNNAIVEVEKNNDIYYKDMFSKKVSFFESGNPAKQNIIKPNKDNILQLLGKKDEQIEELVRSLQKCKDNEVEQLKQITNICLSLAKNCPTFAVTNQNKIKNKFNLNIFLNDKCKNAVNLIDFVKGIQIELQDLLLYNKVGHADAVSQIFDKAYKKLDLTMRPVHCTDIKRETLYVRDENKWLNDESKVISEKALDIISNISLKEMKQWKDANPNYQTIQENKVEYMKLMKNILGGSSDGEIYANHKKMIKNLSQNSQLDKDLLHI
jgi:hypothetical protein